MNKKGLAGDPTAIYMACPGQAAGEMTRRLPPGLILELCCGVGGITRALAASHEVLAVDRDIGRLMHNRLNLGRLRLAQKVRYLCCDVNRPVLLPSLASQKFAACILDPDWSPPGSPPEVWADALSNMEPPARVAGEKLAVYVPLFGGLALKPDIS